MRPATFVSVAVVEPIAYRVGARDDDDALAQAIVQRDAHGPSFAAGELAPPPATRRRRARAARPPVPRRPSPAPSHAGAR